MSEIIAAALDAIDDQVALVGERPVAVDSLWGAALRSVSCAHCNGRDSSCIRRGGPSSRVGVVTAAAATVADDVLARPRSWLLTQASDAEPEATVVVEIAERLVAISGAVAGAEVVAVPRRAEPQLVAEEVASTVAGMAAAVVLIDAPSTVAGAPALATLIADAVRRSGRDGRANRRRPAGPAGSVGPVRRGASGRAVRAARHRDVPVVLDHARGC